MAAHIGQPTQSRRYIKLYLGTWGLMAVGSLAYLAILAFPQNAAAPPQAAVEPAAKPAGASESKSVVAEAPATQAPLSEVRKVTMPPPSSGSDRVETVKVVVQTRAPAPEPPLPDGEAAPQGQTSIPTSDATAPARTALAAAPNAAPVVAAAPPVVSVAPPAVTPASPPVATAPPGIVILPATTAAPSEPMQQAREEETATAAVTAPPPVPIETGSISPKSATSKPETKAEIVFGEPVVTRGGREFAVQLGASPSVQVLRQSWGRLSERHADTLTTLQPRVVAPRSQGGAYRLLAGPFDSKAEAERICSELQVGAKACFATGYAGAPL
ncbi:MAG TPA: SPOR domain-containing protein [Hyphomicrobiaceae bacterium]|nr:SPOR domain-containing protein [Hyphomicrobiaceae bacterium]